MTQSAPVRPVGRTSQTSAPHPLRLAAPAEPPCASAIARAIASPSPAPPPDLASSGRLKRSKARGRKLGREAGALVADVKLHGAVLREGTERGEAAAVTERVVDEVAERLVEAGSVADELHAPRRLHRDASRRSAPATPASSSSTGNWLAPDREPALVGACKDEEVLGQADEAVGLPGSRPKRLLELLPRARAAQGQLQLGLQERQGRPQLVARVRDEAALALEPVLEPTEHRVERLPETADLVAGPGQR